MSSGDRMLGFVDRKLGPCGPEVGPLWTGSWAFVDGKLGPCGLEAGPLWMGSWALVDRKLAPCGPKLILQYTTILERASSLGRLFNRIQRVHNESAHFQVFLPVLVPGKWKCSGPGFEPLSPGSQISSLPG